MTQPDLFDTDTDTPAGTIGDQLRAAGTTVPRHDRCPTCRARIITGLDAPIAAFHVELDPIALTPLGEAIARLQQLRTYELRITRAGHWDIRRRRARRITDRPAGTDDPLEPAFDVVADHRCHQPPAGSAAGSSVLAARRLRAQQATQPTDPPY